MGVYTYDIIESEFYITEEDFKDIKDDDNSIFYANTDLEQERILNQRPVQQYNDFGDACLELERKYQDEVWFAKEGFYKVLMYWIEENDGYSTDEVERNKKFNTVVPKPELNTDEILEQLVSLGEEAETHTDNYSDSEIYMKDMVAITFAIDTIKKYVNSEV